MTQEGKLNISHRRLPHWQLGGSVYYVTTRLRAGMLSESERQLVLDYVVEGRVKFYKLYALIVMPDHLHILLQPNDGFDLSRVMKGVKGVTARLINQQRKTTGRLWQEESYDRIIRNESELNEKVKYMLENTSRAGLVEDPWDYPFWYYNPELF